MILLVGIPSETALVLVREQLERLAARVVVFNQRAFDESTVELAIESGLVTGTLGLGSRRFPLEGFRRSTRG